MFHFLALSLFSPAPLVVAANGPAHSQQAHNISTINALDQELKLHAAQDVNSFSGFSRLYLVNPSGHEARVIDIVRALGNDLVTVTLSTARRSGAGWKTSSSRHGKLKTSQYDEFRKSLISEFFSPKVVEGSPPSAGNLHVCVDGALTQVTVATGYPNPIALTRLSDCGRSEEIERLEQRFLRIASAAIAQQ